MNFVYFYCIGVTTGLLLSLFSKNFHWSIADEPPRSIIDDRYAVLRKVIIWVFILISLFGSGSFID